MRAEKTLIFFILTELLPYIECAVSFTQPTGAPPAYKDVYVEEGRDAKLVWNYSVGSRDALNQNKAVTWSTFIPRLTRNLKNRKELIVEGRNEARRNLKTIPSYLTGRISIENPATLVIRSVKTTDDNFYECQLNPSSIVATAVTSQIKLTVIKLPEIIPLLINRSYNEGTKVDVTCNATGKPTPTVTWIREGSSKVYSTGEGSAALLFSSVSRNDAGQYRCKANNTAGTDETGALSLVVHYPPSITKPSEPTVTQTVWENHNNELICTTDGVPVPRITWTKDGDSVTDNVVKSGNTSTLTLVLNAQNTVNDRYICSVENIRGVDSATFNLVLGPPETKPTTPPPSGPDTGARGGSDISGALIGAIVAGVLGVIIIVVIIIYLLKCRKGNRSNQGPRPVGLKERGTKSVSDIDDYEPVRTQNELPQYASVDRSKKYQRKPDLNYAELDHGGAERSVDQRPINRRSEPTTYADIVQTWEPTDESTYANVPRGGHYSNDML